MQRSSRTPGQALCLLNRRIKRLAALLFEGGHCAPYGNCEKMGRWKEQSTKRLKSFFLDCLGLLVKATTLDTFREVLQHILIVALSPNEGRDKDGHEVPMEASLNFFSKKFENNVLGGESDSQY